MKHSTRISSDADRFSQVEEHPVDGQCTGSARLYVNTECISDSSHIITSQYYSVIAAIARSPWPKYMPAIPINQPILAHIIAITLLMNLKFEYQLKVCVLAVCVATFSMRDPSGSQMVLLLAPLSIVALNRHKKLLV